MTNSLHSRLAAVLVALASGGCATHHVGSDWQCPLVQGIGCQRVADADPARAQSAADPNPGAVELQPVPAPPRRVEPAADPSPAATPETGDLVASEAHGLRTPETIGRIWIAPYVDAHGVYHEAGWVRIVLRPARWRRP